MTNNYETPKVLEYGTVESLAQFAPVDSLITI